MRVEKAEKRTKARQGLTRLGPRAKNTVIFSLFIASNSTFPSTPTAAVVRPFRPLRAQGPCRLQNTISNVDYAAYAIHSRLTYFAASLTESNHSCGPPSDRYDGRKYNVLHTFASLILLKNKFPMAFLAGDDAHGPFCKTFSRIFSIRTEFRSWNTRGENVRFEM